MEKIVTDSSAYAPTIEPVTVTPSWCKLLVTWSSTSIAQDKATITLPHVYSSQGTVSFSLASLD